MTAPTPSAQLLYTFCQPAANRIQVNVSYELTGVILVLANNRFISILKKISFAIVFSVKPAPSHAQARPDPEILTYEA